MIAVFLCSLLSQSVAADPYISAGFLKFGTDVEVGAVSAVAIDREDRVFVLHRGEPPLVAFDAAGNYVRGWGQGLFKVPHGLRVDREGNIWTTDNGNHVLRKFDRGGRLLTTLGVEGKAAGGREGFRAPDDLVFDSHGNIYVADSGNGRIVKLAVDGSYESEWGKKGKEPGQFATAHDLAIDAQDRKITANWGDPQTLLLPHLMAVNSKGTLFIAEVNGKRVQMFQRK